MSDFKLNPKNMDTTNADSAKLDNDNIDENAYSVDEELVSKKNEIKTIFYTTLDDLLYSIMHNYQLFFRN